MTEMAWTVLRTGGEYRPLHVWRLENQLQAFGFKLGTLTNMDQISWGHMDMKFRYPGWWSKMELFNSDIKGNCFYMDLDTAIQDSLDWIKDTPPKKFTILRDFYRPENLQSSLMWITDDARREVWKAWRGHEQEIMDRFAKQRPGLNGDQNFLQEVLGTGQDVGRWQDDYPGKVLSYKVHIKNRRTPHTQLAGSSIVIFHGKPRPWQINW